MTTQHFDLVVKSTILRGERPNKSVDAQEAKTPHQANRVIGYLTDGTKVAIAKRPGKGGVDFNKLLGDKVYAIAADGTSPVFEKDAKGNVTKVQKVEDGLPLYSSSGFYLLSSKDYPALKIGEYFTLLRENGAELIMVSQEQLNQTQVVPVGSEFDLEMLEGLVLEALDDKHNLVAGFDAAINRKRSRAIQTAVDLAQDDNLEYEGAPYADCVVSKRDGNPVVVLFWDRPGMPRESLLVLRQTQVMSAKNNLVTSPLNAEDAWNLFKNSTDYADLVKFANSGEPLTVGIIQGHLMRTSVVFRRKVEAVLAAPSERMYGDAVYIHGALQSWCKGIVSIMHSSHPKFPNQDYPAHYYVVAPRQAEIGMKKRPNNGGWEPPEPVFADIMSHIPATKPQ